MARKQVAMSANKINLSSEQEHNAIMKAISLYENDLLAL